MYEPNRGIVAGVVDGDVSIRGTDDARGHVVPGPVTDVLLAPEVAVLLRLHAKTVYKLAEAGVIPGKRIGRSWRFSRIDVLKFISTKANK